MNKRTVDPHAVTRRSKESAPEERVETVAHLIGGDACRRLSPALVLAAAASLGLMLAAESSIKLLCLFVISAAAAAVVSFQTKHHLAGLAALIVAGVAFPVEIPPYISLVFLGAAFYCLSWLLRLAVSPERRRIEMSRVVLADIALMVSALLSFVAGQYPWFPSQRAPLEAQLAGLGLFLLSGGLLLAVGHQIGTLAHLKKITWLFLAAGGAFCISQSIPGMNIMARWSSPDSVGSMFWIWLVAISCSQALFNQSLSRAARTALLCLMALALYRGIFLAASWASGWLPPLLAAVVILSFRFQRTAIGICALAVPGGLILAGNAAGLLMSHEQYSYATRLAAWRVLLQLVWKSPVFGLGPANYYYYTLMYPILGWYVHFSSHNNYMDLLAQTGVLGMLAFCWLIVEIAQMTLRFCSRAPAGFVRAYAIGILGGLAGSVASGMLADWIIPFVYNIGIRGFRSSFLFWVFLGGMLALHRMIPPGTRQSAVAGCDG